MEKFMSKTNDTSNLDHDTLADTELDAVAGGLSGHKMGPSNFEKKNVTTTTTDAVGVWNQLLHNYGFA
jgi:uncharacterized protein YcfJ